MADDCSGIEIAVALSIFGFVFTAFYIWLTVRIVGKVDAGGGCGSAAGTL
jgi:hypothetical protein